MYHLDLHETNHVGVLFLNVFLFNELFLKQWNEGYR